VVIDADRGRGRHVSRTRSRSWPGRSSPSPTTPRRQGLHVTRSRSGRHRDRRHFDPGGPTWTGRPVTGYPGVGPTVDGVPAKIAGPWASRTERNDLVSRRTLHGVRVERSTSTWRVFRPFVPCGNPRGQGPVALMRPVGRARVSALDADSDSASRLGNGTPRGGAATVAARRKTKRARPIGGVPSGDPAIVNRRTFYAQRAVGFGHSRPPGRFPTHPKSPREARARNFFWFLPPPC